MRKPTARRPLLLLLAAVLAALGIVSIPRAAHALSCSELANRMFSSRSHAVYWAKRYYRAGCGD